MTDTVDVAIIGGSFAGLTAALQLGRASRRVAVFDTGRPRNAASAAAHGVPLHETLLAFLTAAVHGQISVAVRLVPLGQTDGLKVMAALEPAIAAMAEIASTSSLADIGGIAYATDIAQMQHETLEPRIFRS